MTTALNARCAGLWRDADGTPVTITETAGLVATVVLEEPAAGYKVGRSVTLPTAWITAEEAPPPPAATVEIDAAPAVAVCPTCGRPLP